MRHRISILAAGVLTALAFGSSEGEPAAVQMQWKGPATLLAGEGFLAEIEVSNDGETDFVVQTVDVDGDLDRAFALVVTSSTDEVDYGEGTRITIPPLTVPAGGTARVPISGTAFLNGRQGGRVELCDAQGQCFSDRVSSTVQGGPDRAILATWTLPETVVEGETFDVVLTLKNQSGGRDLVKSVGVSTATSEWLKLDASVPPHQGPGSSLGRKVWRYDLKVGAGVDETITFTTVAPRPGPRVASLSVCLASETFCSDQRVEVQVLPAGGAGD
ncbi:MAG: hypothetical protein AB8H79_17630 [Myxococcota bacterium]